MSENGMRLNPEYLGILVLYFHFLGVRGWGGMPDKGMRLNPKYPGILVLYLHFLGVRE